MNEAFMRSNDFVEAILVVEDDQAAQDYLLKLFSSKGYRVEVAGRVDEALRLLSVEHFPVIVTDLGLPDSGGAEILDVVQRQALRSAVLVAAAYGSMESAVEALRRGAYDYISKPFNSDILLHRVARAMEKVRREEEHRLQGKKMADLFQMTQDLSSSLLYATEEERHRISRDLHDGIGQSLSILKLAVKSIRNKIPSHIREVLADLDNLAGHLEETMDDISRILRDLNPTYVQEVGFLPTLRLYLESFEKKTGIHVRRDLPDKLLLSHSRLDVHLYRIAQEALTNVAKHSEATRVSIRLTPADGVLQFSVSDNGKGFDAASETRRFGLGLIGMRERMAFLGGKLQIASAPGQGTTIEAKIPL